MNYRREIDGLRAVALLPVIFFHAGFELFSGGFVGVDVFFVISGYLITSIIIEEQHRGTFSLTRFYERRARRILPALFFVMLVSVLFAFFGMPMLPGDMKAFSQSLAAVSLFMSNVLFWRQSGYFDSVAELKPLLHTWSLAVEEQYYLIFPIFMLFTWRCRRRAVIIYIALALLISLALAQWGSINKPPATFFLLPTRGWELLIGVLVAFYQFSESCRGNEPEGNLSKQIFSLGGLALVGYSIFAFDKRTPFPSAYALLPTLGTAMLILFADGRTIVGKILSYKLLVGTGLISYSAYLWHQPILAFSRLRAMSPVTTEWLLLCVLLSLALAYLSWRYVERPFRSRTGLSQRAILVFSLSGIALFTIIGVLGWITNGYANRLGQWEYIYSVRTAYDAVCHTKQRRSSAQISKGDICTQGSSQPATMAVIGDSHAGAIFDALADSGLMKSQSFWAISGGACAPLKDNFKLQGGNEDCIETTQAAFRQIAESQSIDTVVLVAEWALYTKGYRNSGNGILPRPAVVGDIEGFASQPKENWIVFRRAFQRTVNFLKAHGKRVIVIRSVPEFDEDVIDSIARKILLSNFIPSSVVEIAPRISSKEYQSRNFEVSQVFEETIGIDYLETRDIFCARSECVSVDSRNSILFSDSNHLTYAGAKLVVAELEKILSK